MAQKIMEGLTTLKPRLAVGAPHGAQAAMKIGLALSGGGFRATLYHLGMVRFLRDAGILPNVTHITAVSGGSIIRRPSCASTGAATTVRTVSSTRPPPSCSRSFASMCAIGSSADTHWGLPLHWPRRLAGLSNRKLTRAGLLEYHYEKYLYGDTSLFQLPEHPRLHILATNISEGRTLFVQSRWACG